MRRVYLLFAISYSLLAVSPVYSAPVYPADPDAVNRQWYLQKIGVYEAWGKTQGSREVVVAVIDTGIDLDHPDLAANLWTNGEERIDGLDNDGNVYIDDINGWDFVDGDNDPSPNIFEREVRPQAIHHGTVLAGLIGSVGNNGIGGVGIAWNVRVMPLRALDSRGRGNVATVMEAVRYAVRKGADIINLSFVGPGFDRDLFLTLQDAYKKGVLTVAAVGNKEDGQGVDLDQSPLYPVCYSGADGEDVVLGVAAVDEQDKKSAFSNFGGNCVDLSAPGSNMYGPQYYNPAQGFVAAFGNNWSGSSMATPLVSGTAALIKSLNPAFSARQIRDVLLKSADPVDQANPELPGKLGAGRLNVGRALELAAAGGGVFLGGSRGVPYLLTAPFSREVAEVQLLSTTGTVVQKFSAFGGVSVPRAGARVAAGDVSGDRAAEVVTGAGPGGAPEVRVFRPDGTPVSKFLAYSPAFRGGVEVAVGDVDGDGKAEIITAPGPGGGPQIRIFSATGGDNTFRVVGGFFVYDKRLRGGAHLAVADVDGNGVAEIIVAPGRGLGYRGTVRVFDARGREKTSFAAYPPSVTAGINVAVGDLEGDGTVEIVTAPAGGTSPEVRVYSAVGGWLRAFLAYNERFQGGVNLAIGDIDQDGASEIITGPGTGGGPHLIVFDGFGRPKQQFIPRDPSFRGGLSVGVIKL